MLKVKKVADIIQQKVLLRIIMPSSEEKTFTTNQLIRKNKTMQRNKKLTTGQCEDYIAGCLLDYDYIKKPYRILQLI